MKVEQTAIPGVLLIEPRVFGDDRGFFMESWQSARYAEHGVPQGLVQDNLALSNHGVLRGLHLQHPYSQGKLVQVLQGEVFDVAVDVRRGSPNFGQWVGVHLSGENKRQFWIPEGFAHAFMALSETADVLYKASDYYAPDHERSIRWDDPELAIDWPIPSGALLSGKDRRAVSFCEAELLP